MLPTAYFGLGPSYTQLKIKSPEHLFVDDSVVAYQSRYMGATVSLGLRLQEDLSTELTYQGIRPSQVYLSKAGPTRVRHQLLAIDAIQHLCLNDDIDLFARAGMAWFWSETASPLTFSRSQQSHVYHFSPRFGMGADYQLFSEQSFFIRSALQYQKGNGSFRYAVSLQAGLYCYF